MFSRAYQNSGADPSRDLSSKQRAFDSDRSRRRVWLGTRRSGKTRGLVVHALRNTPAGEITPWCSTTIGWGRQTLWKQLEQLDKEFSLRLRYDRSKHLVHLPNGGGIQLYGLSTITEAEKLRGNRFPLGIVDECGAQNQSILEYAVRECLSPATMDFLGRGGRGIVLAGTPSKLVDTWWHEQCRDRDPGKDGFHFTSIYDNPWFAGREEVAFQEFCNENNIKRTDAAFIREMEGRFVIDLQALCYGWDHQVLPAAAIPSTGMTFMGVDFGTTHPCAFVVIRSVPPHAWVCEVYEEAGMTIHQVAAKVNELRQKWKAGHVVGDSEGAMAIKSLRNDFGIPIESALKVGRKVDRIWFLDSCLKTGTLFLCPDTKPLQEQLISVGWNDRRDDHHEKQNDHSLDACHYALELANQIGSIPKPAGPVKDSPEYFRQKEEQMKAWAFAQANETRRRSA